MQFILKTETDVERCTSSLLLLDIDCRVIIQYDNSNRCLIVHINWFSRMQEGIVVIQPILWSVH